MLRLKHTLDNEREILQARLAEKRTDRLALSLIKRLEDNIRKLEKELENATSRQIPCLRKQTAKHKAADTVLQHAETPSGRQTANYQQHYMSVLRLFI
jgi:cob(I)alamin adenosyltransferase